MRPRGEEGQARIEDERVLASFVRGPHAPFLLGRRRTPFPRAALVAVTQADAAGQSLPRSSRDTRPFERRLFAAFSRRYADVTPPRGVEQGDHGARTAQSKRHLWRRLRHLESFSTKSRLVNQLIRRLRPALRRCVSDEMHMVNQP